MNEHAWIRALNILRIECKDYYYVSFTQPTIYSFYLRLLYPTGLTLFCWDERLFELAMASSKPFYFFNVLCYLFHALLTNNLLVYPTIGQTMFVSPLVTLTLYQLHGLLASHPILTPSCWLHVT